jgi:hypothetical protein
VAPANPSSALVAISGILQDPTTYSVSGTTLTFSSAPPIGTGNISVRYLGIPASGVTTTAYRTVTEFTATAGQTTFSPASYTVGFITVYRNGVRLGTADFTATNGTSVVLNNACTVGDLVTTEAMLVSSVVNALPSTGGTVAGNMVVSGTLSASGSAILGTSAASLALSVKSPSDYRAAIFETASLAGPSVQIKGSKTYELRSTNTGASEGAGLFFIYDKDNEASRLTIDSSGNVKLSTAGTKILNSSGNPILQQTGSILQVVQSVYSTIQSTTSTSYISAGAAATITPISSTSKILAQVSVTCGNGTNQWHFVTLYRGSTNIAGGSGNPAGYINNNSGDYLTTLNFQILDSPATTSATTYTLYNKAGSGNNVRTQVDSMPTYITLIEVAA